MNDRYKITTNVLEEIRNRIVEKNRPESQKEIMGIMVVQYHGIIGGIESEDIEYLVDTLMSMAVSAIDCVIAIEEGVIE